MKEDQALNQKISEWIFLWKTMNKKNYFSGLIFFCRFLELRTLIHAGTTIWKTKNKINWMDLVPKYTSSLKDL